MHHLSISAQRLLEIPAVLFVFFAVVIHSLATEDLQPYDESGYMAAGLVGPLSREFGFSDGPTYSDMYWLLSHGSSDPVVLYLAGRAMAALLLVFGVWLSARLLSNAALAWVAAATIAASFGPYAWPGVAAPATAAVLVALALCVRFPGPFSLGAGTGLVWLAAGSRPELVWAAVIASCTSVIYCAWWWRARHIGQRRMAIYALVVVAAGTVVVPAALIFMHGSPFADGGRSWVAFSQHFSIRNAVGGENPWLDSGLVVARSFPGASSVREALQTSPGAFLGHVGANLREIPYSVIHLLGSSTTTVHPYRFIAPALFLSVVGGLVVALIAGRGRLREQWRHLRNRLISRDLIGAWVILAVCIATVLASICVIYPRVHYLLILQGGLVVLVVALHKHLGSQRFTSAIPVAVAIVGFTAFSFVVAQEVLTRAVHPAPVASAISRMNAVDQEWRILGDGKAMDVYLPRMTAVMNVVPKQGETLSDLLDRERINVVLRESPSAAQPWTTLPEFQDFLANPQRYGFTYASVGSDFLIRQGVSDG